MTATPVFVSYQDRDSGWVRSLVESLEHERVPVFVRDRDIDPGDIVLGRIESAIGAAGTAVLVLSADLAADAEAGEEYAALLRAADERGLRLIPVLYGDSGVVIPPMLGGHLWADFRGVSDEMYRRKLGDLAAVIRGGPAGPDLQRDLLDATRPEPRDRDQEPAPPSFVVTYAKPDAGYGTRLVDWFAGHHLPVWSIAELHWGEQFVWQIRRRLRTALAVVVVMSPDAEDSPHVEREILEGERRDRLFLPVLLRGEPSYLLAGGWHFDARSGALPGPPELRLLRRVHRDREEGRQPTAPPRPPVRTRVRRAPRVDLGRLPAALAEGYLTHADLLTTRLLLGAAGRLEDGWLSDADGALLDDRLLTDIDDTWSAATGGRQGFRRQGELHQMSRGHGADFLDMAVAYGWRRPPDGRPSYGELAPTPRYGALIDQADGHEGFFPTLRNPQWEPFPEWSTRWHRTVLVVHRRMQLWREGRWFG